VPRGQDQATGWPASSISMASPMASPPRASFPVVDDDKRAATLARRKRGESIRTIAAGVKVSVGVVHKTLTDAQQDQQP